MYFSDLLIELQGISWSKMALPILSNWLSRKIRYSLMATIVFRFMIGSNVEQVKFDLSTFGSTLAVLFD